MKALIYSLFFILYSLVTFFGIGPVFMADGPANERFITLVVVILIYIALTYILLLWRKKNKK